ncbi:MAG: prolyl oligopeptidase family serine peptidase [Pseudonocardiaceae bacterium]
MAGVDHALELGLADSDRLGVFGVSGGGTLTGWIIGHTDRFKAACPENPLTHRRAQNDALLDWMNRYVRQ